MDTPAATGRIEVVDALRGAALAAIVLVHCLEHYNIYYIPENAPQWLAALDKGVWDMTWFLFAGKAFSLFSLLFGLSFHIQLTNARKRGVPFRGRFVWRMFILLLISQFHSLFYNGDILLLYSVMGLLLPATCRLSTRTVLILAVVMIIQPLEWIRLGFAMAGIPFLEYGNHWMAFAEKVQPVVESGGVLEVIRSNITYGQLYGNLWQIENGRVFQIGALFLFGMVSGRLGLFDGSTASRSMWKRILILATALFLPFQLLKSIIPQLTEGCEELAVPLGIAVPSICNFLFMTILAGLFTLMWYDRGNGYRLQRIFIPYGRMSLTNYILQSVIGVSLFYGFGLGLFRSTGATVCVLIAAAIVSVQLLYSRWWLASHRQGPLEWAWKKLTWLRSGRASA